jgi:uncharacterized protein YbbC (DUF1343 family)
VATGIHMIETARRLWPKEFGWRPASDMQGALPVIDRLYGSAALREQIDAGASAGEIIRSWDTSAYQTLHRKVQLYSTT